MAAVRSGGGGDGGNHTRVDGSRGITTSSNSGVVDGSSATSARTSSVWYFSYGGNMSSQTLSRRGVKPQKSVPGRLMDYRLVFSYMGYEGVEPRFGNLEPIDGRGSEDKQIASNVCHGVAHFISLDELSLLDKYEGAGYAYKRINVPMEPYSKDGTATGKVGRKRKFVETDTKNYQKGCASVVSSVIDVFVYVALPSHRANPGLPSKRYLKLLVDGAEAHGLDAAFVHGLRAQASYEWKGAVFPRLDEKNPALANVLTFEEISNHGYESENRNKLVWAHIGGLVFDVTARVGERAMLRNMSGAVGATRYVCRMWNSAFGSPFVETGTIEVESRLELQNEDVHMDMLKDEVSEYVASWAHNLIRQDCPIIGVSSHFKGPQKLEDVLPVKPKGSGSISSDLASANEMDPQKFSKHSTAAISAATKATSDKKKFESRLYHFELGIEMPMTLLVRIRVARSDREWWLEKEKSLLCELSAGLSANAESLFENVQAHGKWKHRYDGTMEEIDKYIPLETMSFRYIVSEYPEAHSETRVLNVLCSDTRADEAEGNKHAKISNGVASESGASPACRVVKPIIMPFLMTCTVLPLSSE